MQPVKCAAEALAEKSVCGSYPLQQPEPFFLATVEAIFNLGTLGRNDTSATPMSDLFRGGIP